MITRPFGSTGVSVPVIGQGTWHRGENRRIRKAEVAALKLGIELGMTHIDTAEMYAGGETPFVGVSNVDVEQMRAAQVALNFLTRRPSLLTIPRATRREHGSENAGALDFTLTPDDLSAIEAERRR